MTTYLVEFKFQGRRAFYVDASDEDEACEQAAQLLEAEKIGESDPDLIGVTRAERE